MREARKPNLNGPRYRKPSKNLLTKEFIKKLRENVPGCNVLSDDQIKEVIYKFNTNVWKTVIEVRDGVELPNLLGHVFIGTCQPKKSKNVDFKASADYLKVIQHRNWESDNYLAKIFYTTYGTRYRFKNNEIWAFNPARAFTRMVGKTYPQLWKQYVVVDPTRKISKLFKSYDYQMQRVEQTKDTIENYNEFDL